jgi:hypothetical protein
MSVQGWARGLGRDLGLRSCAEEEGQWREGLGAAHLGSTIHAPRCYQEAQSRTRQGQLIPPEITPLSQSKMSLQWEFPFLLLLKYTVINKLMLLTVARRKLQ